MKIIFLFTLLFISTAFSKEKFTQPNFIVILADDLGYGDLECFGAGDIKTPNIDQMAKEGTTFTSFYVSAVCSPTRASLMTGCHPQRVGIGGVIFNRSENGLEPSEITLAEALKSQGYSTALIGKWHLGNKERHMPNKQGFDYWYGTIASNNMGIPPNSKTYSQDCVWREGYSLEKIKKMELIKCPLVKNNVVIEAPANQSLFTQRYTKETIQYIKANKEEPFFIFLSHNMPHVPLYASEKFIGSSQRGLYGDAIQELDWSTGEILKTLKEEGLDNNTFVIFTSDNGPNLKHNGNATPLRGQKANTYEGGVRVPCIMRWPNRIPTNKKINEPAIIFDLFPTFTHLAGGGLPSDRVIDGKNIWSLINGTQGNTSTHDVIYYIKGNKARGIRIGDWKYRYTKLDLKINKGMKADSNGMVRELYNLKNDLSELNNLAQERPEQVQTLHKMMTDFENRLKQESRVVY